MDALSAVAAKMPPEGGRVIVTLSDGSVISGFYQPPAPPETGDVVEDQEAICIVIGDVEQRDALHVWVNPRFIATAMAGGDDDEIVPAHLRKRIA